MSGVPEKVNRFLLRIFNNKTEFIEIFKTVTLEYYQHFYKVSKKISRRLCE